MADKFSKSSIYQAKFQKWVATSTSHGIPNIFRSKNPIIRVIWALAVLVSCGYCVVSIVRSVMDFTRYKTTLSSQIYQEIPAPFPAITVCNLNPFNHYYSNWYVVGILLGITIPQCLDYTKILYTCDKTGYANQTLCMDNINNLNRDCGSGFEYDLDLMQNLMAEKLNDEFSLKKEYLGFHLFGDMLLTCNFNNKLCDPSDFTTFYHYRYGNCYTFNGDINNTKKVNQKGSQFNIELALNDYRSPYDYREERGLYLVVHNQSAQSFTLTKGITLPTGNKVHVKVDRVFTEKLAEPYSNCIDELESDNPYSQRLFGFFRDLNITYYDQDLCYTLCNQDKLIDKCGCLNSNTPKIRNASYCWNSTYFDCMTDIYPIDLDQIYQEYCIPACPEKCNTINYDLNLNYAAFPTDVYMIQMKRVIPDLPNDSNELYKYGRDSYIKVSLNYKDLEYTVLEENALVTTESLLGNIGGQLGLFIGISFLSFIEIIEVAIEILNAFYKERHSIRKAGKRENICGEGGEDERKQNNVPTNNGDQVYTIANEVTMPAI